LTIPSIALTAIEIPPVCGIASTRYPRPPLNIEWTRA
jgi:hypothetical protein